MPTGNGFMNYPVPDAPDIWGSSSSSRSKQPSKFSRPSFGIHWNNGADNMGSVYFFMGTNPFHHLFLHGSTERNALLIKLEK